MLHDTTTEPKPEHQRETEMQESLDKSHAAQEEAASVIDDVLRRLERLSAEMRRHRESERAAGRWHPSRLIDPREDDYRDP